MEAKTYWLRKCSYYCSCRPGVPCTANLYFRGKEFLGCAYCTPSPLISQIRTMIHVVDMPAYEKSHGLSSEAECCADAPMTKEAADNLIQELVEISSAQSRVVVAINALAHTRAEHFSRELLKTAQKELAGKVEAAWDNVRNAMLKGK